MKRAKTAYMCFCEVNLLSPLAFFLPSSCPLSVVAHSFFLIFFLFFYQENRAKFKEQNPEAKPSEMMTLLAAGWKACPEEERGPYVEKAKKDKERYLREKGLDVEEEKEEKEEKKEEEEEDVIEEVEEDEEEEKEGEKGGGEGR